MSPKRKLPEFDDLFNEIRKIGFEGIIAKYGVSRQAIHKQLRLQATFSRVLGWQKKKGRGGKRESNVA